MLDDPLDGVSAIDEQAPLGYVMGRDEYGRVETVMNSCHGSVHRAQPTEPPPSVRKVHDIANLDLQTSSLAALNTHPLHRIVDPQ
jgi:hypothetical protein